MDNNTPVVPTPVQTPAPAPNPTPVPISDPVTTSGGNNNKLIIILVIGLVVLTLAVAGFYFYSMNQDGAKKSAPTTQTDTNNIDQLESDLSSMTIDNPDADLTAVDTDLQGL